MTAKSVDTTGFTTPTDLEGNPSPSPEAPARSSNLMRPATARATASEQRAQAALMMQRRLFDPARPKVADLAKELGISRQTASKRLALARADGVPDEARLIAIKEMLPQAMAVALEVMNGEDRKVAWSAAKFILEKLEAIQVPKPDLASLGSGKHVEETLEVWRERIKVRRTAVADVESAAVAAGPAPIDAVVVPGPAEAVYLPAGGGERLSAESAEDTPGVGPSSGRPGVAEGPARS